MKRRLVEENEEIIEEIEEREVEKEESMGKINEEKIVEKVRKILERKEVMDIEI